MCCLPLQLQDEASTLKAQASDMRNALGIAQAQHQVMCAMSESAALLAAHHASKRAACHAQKAMHVMHACAESARMLLQKAAVRRQEAMELSKKIMNALGMNKQKSPTGLQEKGLAKAHLKRLQVRAKPLQLHCSCS
jgi:hypothetical protein